MKFYEFTGIKGNYLEADSWSRIVFPTSIRVLEYFTGNSEVQNTSLGDIKKRIIKELQEIPINFLDSSINCSDTVKEWKEFRRVNLVIGKKVDEINKLINNAERNLSDALLNVHFIYEAQEIFKKAPLRCISFNYNELNDELRKCYRI